MKWRFAWLLAVVPTTVGGCGGGDEDDAVGDFDADAGGDADGDGDADADGDSDHAS